MSREVIIGKCVGGKVEMTPDRCQRHSMEHIHCHLVHYVTGVSPVCILLALTWVVFVFTTLCALVSSALHRVLFVFTVPLRAQH